MPSKKSKVNASKGKTTATPELAQAAGCSSSGPIEPPTSTPSSNLQPNLPPPNFSDDFWTKNARAKALIMSTLVPGSEAWKIAEPIELASNVMRALEERYSGKDKGKGLAIWDRDNSSMRGATKLEEDPASSDFIGDFVAGRPMDKYLNLYKDKLALAQLHKSAPSSHNRKPPLVPIEVTEEIRKGMIASTLAHLSTKDNDEVQAAFNHLAQKQAARLRSLRDAEADLPIPKTFDLSSSPPASPMPATTSLLSRWRQQPIKHDCYLTEYQATIFSNNDLDRKKQIQVAATKVLMQKLPSRELRLLWAVLYGGADAPWPGSHSAVIPGVTTMHWGNLTRHLDYKTNEASWIEGKG